MESFSQPIVIPDADELDSAVSTEDESDYDYVSELSLRDINQSLTIKFSIRANYTSWKPREAFRELVQNWRDSIVKTFNLSRPEFHVIREERTAGRNTEIVYKVLHPKDEPKHWLGYIRFKARDGKGSIDITNRGATLQPWHLDLGATDKSGDGRQAGAHGEGLKVALLVLMRGRQNHSVRCRSGGFNWRFNFTTQGKLVARLRRMPTEAIRKAEDRAQRQATKSLLPFAAAPSEDVQFVLGEPCTGRNEWGGSTRRNAISRESFDEWTRAAMFLQDTQDEGVITTNRGDLIINPHLRGNIYLMGLLLKESTAARSASITNQPLKYGYNFATGTTNRERESVANAYDEVSAIIGIWSKVVILKPLLVQEFSDMLNTAEPIYADVWGAERHIKVEMACKLKEHLTSEPFQRKWYFTAEEKIENLRLDHVIHGLGCDGVELTKPYWTILRKYGLVRTAVEEERRSFMAAESAPTPQTPFAASVSRLFRACIRACPKTDGINIEFVKAGSLDLQLFYLESERLFKIHENWLTRELASDELGLLDGVPENDIVFHTVKALFADALDQMPPSSFPGDGARTGEWQKRLELSRGIQRLLDYFHRSPLTADTSSFDCHMTLSVPSGAAETCDSPIEIQIHSSASCSRLWDAVLLTGDATSRSMACIKPSEPLEHLSGGNNEQYTCRTITLPIGRTHVTEYDLREDEEYFAVLLVPSVVDSFIVLSTTKRTGRSHAQAVRRPVNANKRLDASRVARKSAPFAPLRRIEVETPSPDGVSDHESNAYTGDNASLRTSPNTPDRLRSRGQAPTAASPNNTYKPPADSFTPGARLQALDFFKMDADRWYEAVSTNNVKAVIGILKGEPQVEVFRKRRRVEF